MSVELTFFGYALSFVLETAVLCFGFLHLWRHPFRLQKHQECYLLFFIVLCYVLNLMEKIVVGGKDAKWFSLIHPLGNLSPFLFTVSFIAIFLPEGGKQVFRTVCGIMCLAMIFAGYYNTITKTLNFEPWLYTCIIFDNFAHIVFGLYGFYIVRNNVAVYDKKTKRIACFCVLGVTFTVLLLNAIFKTSFFGLNLYGKHNIYNLVLTKNSYLSALLYFIGLTSLLTLGCHFARVIQTKASAKGTAPLFSNETKEGGDDYARV